MSLEFCKRIRRNSA